MYKLPKILVRAGIYFETESNEGGPPQHYPVAALDTTIRELRATASASDGCAAEYVGSDGAFHAVRRNGQRRVGIDGLGEQKQKVAKGR
jgi:hypothetical protein